MLYIAILIFIVRTIYVIYHNRIFDRFDKNIRDYLLSQNLHLNPNLWEAKAGRYIDELPTNFKSIGDPSKFEIMNKPIYSKDNDKIEAFVFTWKKKLSNFDILMGYNMSHNKIGSIKLDKGEIRDKNIERILG